MAATTEQHAVQTTFHLQVTPEQTLVLPDELLRQLQVAVGDVLAVSVSSGHGWVSKAPPPSWCIRSRPSRYRTSKEC